MKVNVENVVSNLNQLGRIGFTDDSGIVRLSYSDKFNEGRNFVEGLMIDAGLETNVDRVGNLTGVWKGLCKKKIAIGSHIDVVPGGGIYDGTLGVLAAIQCIKELKQSGYRNQHTLEVIAFTEEEGNVIGGTFGSKCFAGQKIEDAEIQKMENCAISGEAVKQALRKKKDYKCYLEYHIEQGGVLECEEKSIGIVEGIVGIIRFTATVSGKSNHAGTTPMKLRDDAVVKSCSIITDVTSYVTVQYSDMVCTVGNIWVPNGVANVIPGKCQFIIELRYRELPAMYQVIRYMEDKYGRDGLVLEQYLEQSETVMDENIISVIENACKEGAYSYKRMFSGAGHDAMNMNILTRCGMIFIPSIGGISHNPKEYSRPEDIGAGMEILKNVITKLDKED